MMPRLLRNALPPLLIAVCALIYFGLYFRCGFNLPDEGSAALLAKRILDGELPIRDLTLGYNVLWFYPITGLFALFGPNLLVMRAWFFLLQIATAFFASACVARISGKRWLGVVAAVLLIIIPGPQHKAYIPLIVIANGWCLTRMIFGGEDARKLAFHSALGGVALALALLIRIDIGIFLVLLWFGAIALRVCGADWKGRRAGGLFGGYAALSAAAFLVHAPVIIDAQRRGFGGDFLEQYPAAARYIGYSLSEALRPTHPNPSPSAPVAAAPSPASDAPAKAAPAKEEASRETLARKPLSDVWKKKQSKHRALPFLTYAPIAGTAVILAAAALLLMAFRREKDSSGYPRFLAILTVVGAALTAFPQFYFFRPDIPHLAEFMPGFIVALVCGSAVTALNFARAGACLKIAMCAPAAFAALHLWVYFAHVFPRVSAGTAALREGRTALFQGENGVHVLLTKGEHEAFRQIHDLVTQNAAPSDYVVCYPYAPGINFMTNRRTYERSLFIDNATRGSKFDEETIAKIERYRPAVIAIDDWKINGSEDSSFSRWAAPTKSYIEKTYHFRGTFERQQIFTREPPPPREVQAAPTE